MMTLMMTLITSDHDDDDSDAESGNDDPDNHTDGIAQEDTGWAVAQTFDD